MKKICLVEDEPFIIEALKYLFEAQGWTVDVISDGAKAVDEVTALQPDILILDYMLPNKSGLNIAKEIRGNTTLDEMPILMLTAKGQAKDKTNAQLAGIQHYMTKPFSNDALLQMVNTLMDGDVQQN